MPGEAVEWVEPLRVAESHPCLPGHFPEQPVIPGVLLLDRVAARLERERAGALRRISNVKFRSPLLPGQEAELHIVVRGSHVGFRAIRAGEVLMSGDGELA